MSQTVDIRELNERIESKSSFVNMITMGMDKVIVGQKHLVESLLIGLLSDGHILLEGVPGLAKTLAIKTLASLIDAQYSRIQFTPDLLPVRQRVITQSGMPTHAALIFRAISTFATTKSCMTTCLFPVRHRSFTQDPCPRANPRQRQ